jgi:hypothetical protein
VKRLSDKLVRSRQQRFVGREAELELFRAALEAPEPPFAVLHFYGPGGVGKTTLLHELMHIATADGLAVIHLDGRNLEPAPAAFAAAARPPDGCSGRFVLLIDTYERLLPLDRWLRGTFLAELPADTLIVIAGRHAPTAWLDDSGWAGITRIVALGNLPRDASRTYLAARGMPAEQQAAALDFTHGPPLATGPGERDVIRLLLERFLEDVPSTLHRQALEVCAVVRATTEDLLAACVGEEHAFALFQWLRRLSFVEQGPYGLFPHDIVREVLEGDLSWRNPTGHDAIRRAARRHLRRQVQLSAGIERQRLRMDILFLNRRDPGMASYFVWDALDTAYAERATSDDHPAILAMIRRHEGAASAEIARYWQERQPEAFLIYRTPAGEVYGCMAQLALERATDADAAIDPAILPALRYIEIHRPLEPGDAASYMRFWMAAGSYQAISPAVNITAANCVIHWTTTPRLVWSMVAMSNPDLMAPHFESIRFRRTPDADFVVGQRRYGCFSHNWASEPVAAWLTETRHGDVEPLAPEPAPAVQTLNETEFAAALRHALRDFTRPDLLATNPLLHTALLGSADRTPGALQALVRDAVETLNHNPKDARLYRALWQTYIEPAGTQEQAAEHLDLPFNTYRYHLANGLQRLAAFLWRRIQSDTP